MSRRRIASLLTAAFLIGATALVAAAPVAAHSPSSRAQVLLDTLSSPKGLAIGKNGTLVVGQGAFGAPGPVLKVKPTWRPVKTTPLTAPLNVVDVAVTPDGARWLIGGDLKLYRQVAGRHSPPRPGHGRLPGGRSGPGQLARRGPGGDEPVRDRGALEQQGRSSPTRQAMT